MGTDQFVVGGNLYEAMDKRFPPTTNTAAAVPGLPATDLNLPDTGMGMGYEAQQKRAHNWYYLLGLISKNRTK